MEHTNIEWCDHTFNPWEGCQKVGPGCDNCYAQARNARYGGGKAINWGPGAPRRRTGAQIWNKPLKWQSNAKLFFSQHGRRQRVFCASLADWLDNEVPPMWRLDLLRVIFSTPDIDWLLLTKRIGNLVPMVEESIRIIENQPDWSEHKSGQKDEDLRNWLADWVGLGKAPANVQIGATITCKAEADRDITKLLDVPARVRFLSMEPLLGPVDLTNIEPTLFAARANVLTGKWKWEKGPTKVESPPIDWVIVGGESGPDARPLHPNWVKSLREQCANCGVPFLFKQWGEWLPINQMDVATHQSIYKSKKKARKHECQDAIDACHGRSCTVPTSLIHQDGSLHSLTDPMAFLTGTGAVQTFKVGKKKAGRLIDGRIHNEFPTQQQGAPA